MYATALASVLKSLPESFFFFFFRNDLNVKENHDADKQSIGPEL